MKTRSILLVSLAWTVAVGHQTTPANPEAFLKWAMDRNKALPSFQATGKVKMDFGAGAMGAGDAMAQDRSVVYQAPNRFKVVSSKFGFVQTSVCDGKKLVEYSSMDQPAMSFGAPESIADAHRMQMQHPMFCGSLLYQFFGGSANFAGLVKVDKGPVTFGGEEITQGEKSRVVKFYGQETFGHVQALIGEKTGRVYRIRYDSEPLMKMMSDPKMLENIGKIADESLNKMKPGADKDAAKLGTSMMGALKGFKLPNYETVETYSDITSPKVFPAGAFSVAIPSAKKVQEMGVIPSKKPPVPIGSPAPDFVVTTLDGKPVRLSSFRGHVVLIDFWATWCPPCREGLPETNRIAKFGANQGLQVLTISDEDPSVISKFVKENHYTFPTYCDASNRVGKQYKIDAIPVTVIIDREGKIRSFMMGLHQPDEIEAALRKVGIKVN